MYRPENVPFPGVHVNLRRGHGSAWYTGESTGFAARPEAVDVSDL
jgi:hypothetical protein